MLGHHPLARHSALSWLRGGPPSSAPGSVERMGMGRAKGVEGCGQAGLTQLLEIGESLMAPQMKACVLFAHPKPWSIPRLQAKGTPCWGQARQQHCLGVGTRGGPGWRWGRLI